MIDDKTRLDILTTLDRAPDLLPLYQVLEARILEEFPDVTIRATKTQIAFRNRYGFAYLWPPTRRVKGRPGRYLVLTFGLGHQVQDRRIVESVEPYPNRWTHHVIIETAQDLDDQTMDWLREAYSFSMLK